MNSLNHVTISGRLTRDVELRYTGTGIAVATFSLAVSKEYVKDGEKKEVTIFTDCKAWREQAERVAEKFNKGAAVVVIGELGVEAWTDKATNQKRSKMLVTANYIAPMFVGFKKEQDATPKRESQPQPSAPESNAEDQDDVPF